MKRQCITYFLVFLLTFSFINLIPTTSNAASYDATIFVDTDMVIENDFMGVGVQWDPSETYDYTASQWNTLYQRADNMNFKLVRCLFNYTDFVSRFDSNGNPVYVWDSTGAQRFYKVLDYCQSRGVDVLTGVWRKADFPQITSTDDLRNATMAAEIVSYLINTKGYTCLKYFNYTNEPNYSVEDASFTKWNYGVQNLYNAFQTKGLNSQIKISGPDTSNSDGWIHEAAIYDAPFLEIYDYHRYAWDLEIDNSSLESTIRGHRNDINSTDPNGTSKKFIMAEAGLYNGRNLDDQQTRIRDFTYGVYMADYVAQSIRGGQSGVVLWMFDDSMHAVWKNGQPTTMKTWGFWDIVNEPSIRHWFYPMSLYSKYFPKGSKTVNVQNTGVNYLKGTAALIPNGSKYDVSISIVNNQSAAKTVRVAVPGAYVTTNLQRYNYLENDRPVDNNGFPVQKEILNSVNLAEGFEITIPGKGMVMLTSMGVGTPFTLTAGAKDIESRFTLRDTLNDWSKTYSHTTGLTFDSSNPSYFDGDTARVKRNANTQESIVYNLSGITDFSIKAYYSNVIDGKVYVYTSPDNVNWTAASTYFDISAATSGGWSRTYVKPVNPIPIGTNYLKVMICSDSRAYNPQISEVNIDTRPTIVDSLSDWSKTYSHTTDLTFDSTNPSYFGGDSTRVKRISDTPQGVVYYANSIKEFTARIFYRSSVNSEKVRFYISSDGNNWTKVLTNNSYIGTSNSWGEAYFRPCFLFPDGTKYLKIELANDSIIYAPQIGQMFIK